MFRRATSELIASPLTSPDEVFYSAGLFGWPFAFTYFVAAISAGISGGFLAHYGEGKGWLTGQVRFTSQPVNKYCAKDATVLTSNTSSYSNTASSFFS